MNFLKARGVTQFNLREERDPNIRQKANQKNRHLVVAADNNTTTTTSPTVSPARKRSTSNVSEEFTLLQEQLKRKRQEYDEDMQKSGKQRSISTNSNGSAGKRESTELDLASFGSDNGELSSSSTPPIRIKALSGSVNRLMKNRVSSSNNNSNSSFDTSNEYTAMSSPRQRNINNRRKYSHMSLEDNIRNRWTIRFSPVSSPRSSPPSPLTTTTSREAVPVDSSSTPIPLKPSSQFHTTKLEQLQSDQRQHLEERLSTPRKDQIYDEQLYQLQKQIRMAEQTGQIPVDNDSSQNNNITKSPTRFNAAKLLYLNYLKENSNNNTLTTAIHDHDYEHEIQLEVEMTELIKRLVRFEKSIRGVYLVTTIKASDERIQERTSNEDELFVDINENNSDNHNNHNHNNNNSNNLEESILETIQIDFMNPSAQDLEKIQQIVAEDDSFVISPDHSEDVPDGYDGDLNSEEEEIQIFEDEDDIEVQVDSDENFLLNVNPSDKLEFCTLEQLLNKCLKKKSAVTEEESVAAVVDNRYYIQTFATSFTTLLHLHSVQDIITVTEQILNSPDTTSETQQALIVLFGEWIFFGLKYFDDHTLLDRVYHIIQPYLTQAQNLPVVAELLGRLAKLKHVLTMREKAQQNILRRVDHLSDKISSFSVLRVDMLKLGMELTLIEWDLFQLLLPQEFFASAWMKGDKQTRAPNLTAMISCYNMVSNWVVETILQYKDINERYKVLCRFISLAWNCISVRNYNGCFSIIAGLYTTPIHRLQKTWSMLNEDYRKLVDKLMFVSNVSSNHRNYRAELKKAKTPAIPNIAVHLKDVASLDDAQVDHSSDNTKEFNISKRHALAVLVRSLLRYQQYPFSFKSNTQLRNNLWYSLLHMMNRDETVKQRSNRWLVKSRELEPPPKKR
jgi:hypothetical protein